MPTYFRAPTRWPREQGSGSKGSKRLTAASKSASRGSILLALLSLKQASGQRRQVGEEPPPDLTVEDEEGREEEDDPEEPTADG